MKKFLSLIAIMLMVAMIASTAVLNAFATDAVTDGESTPAEPDDIPVVEFASGTGTELDPYTIATAEQLIGFSAVINNAITNVDYVGLYYKLTADIDLGGVVFDPIGGGDNKFSGFFDGDGHTVSNFIVKANRGGLFGCVDNATIKNVKIDHANIQGEHDGAGGIVGMVGNNGSLTIDNCQTGANVLITGNAMGDGCMRMGGIWGNIGTSVVVNASNCVNRAYLLYVNTARNDAGVGGIGGGIRNGSAVNCVNLGSIYVEFLGSQTVNAGGIFGITIAPTELTIENVINGGNVTGWTRGGGIIGYLHTGKETTVIKNAYTITTNYMAYDAIGTVIGALKASQTATLTNVKYIEAKDFTDYTIEPVGGTVAANLTDVVALKSIDELVMDIEYNAILTSLGLDLPTAPVAPDQETLPEVPGLEVPDVPVDTPADTPADTPVETPADTPVDTPADTGDKTEPTTPVTDPVTPGTDPETEKPAEGGCGSVVAGGIAILAVVTLAGVALKKKD